MKTKQKMLPPSYTLPFASNSQVIGCEDCLRNDLYCVGCGVKLYSIKSPRFVTEF